MVYNEAGEPGKGKEVTLVNPKIVKFSKQKDLFEEGCLSFPKIYAEVEVRFATRPPERTASFCQPTPTPNPPARANHDPRGKPVSLKQQIYANPSPKGAEKR